jgi:hypothetical protein
VRFPGWQDPAQADKLSKIQRDLDETKVILHRTIESVLDRGEKLDQVPPCLRCQPVPPHSAPRRVD